jgi:acyl-CoA synthetase (AMP-forming)/AMP-acid ligase II
MNAVFSNLGDLIDRSRSAADLDKPAIIDLSRGLQGRSVSYRELDDMAARVAGWLSGRGYARGDRIAVLAANCVEFLACFHGILRAGLVAVPVNFKFPPSTIEYVLRDSGARMVFCDAARRDAVPADLPVVCFDAEANHAASGAASKAASSAASNAALPALPQLLASTAAGFASVVPAAGETAMYLYTSGSTGKPKGVVLSHQSHLWVAQTRLAGKDWSSQRLLVAAPLYHMNALALAQFASLAHATVVLLPQFNARSYIEAIAIHRCTWLTSVPPMMAMMMRETDLMQATDFSCVQFIRMGSAPVTQSLIDQLRAYFPKASILNGYGTTEAGPVVFGPHPKGVAQPELSVGYPHPQVSLRIQGGGDEGVLEMKSPANMDGYHNLPELTRKVMTADGYYVTGDVFRRDADGFHYFVGRTDDMFVSGAENLYPGEIEKMLERHAAVEQACVVPVPDDIKGTKPVAFIVLKAGADATEQQIKDHALAHAPAYAHPRRVWFVREMPLSGTNKIERKTTLQMALDRLAVEGPLA